MLEDEEGLYIETFKYFEIFYIIIKRKIYRNTSLWLCCRINEFSTVNT
jgi:hypothetical protein